MDASGTKVRMELLPPYALAQIASVLAHGADKHGEWNWRLPSGEFNEDHYLGAILRHANLAMAGQDVDPGTGISHYAHIAATCMIVLDALLLKAGNNRRTIRANLPPALQDYLYTAMQDRTVPLLTALTDKDL